MIDYVQIQGNPTFRPCSIYAQQLLLTRSKHLFFTVIVVTGKASEVAAGVHDEGTSKDIDRIKRIAIIVIIVRIVAFTPITSLGRVRVAGSIPFPRTEWYLILAVAGRQ